VSGPAVPERIHQRAGDSGWAGDLHASAVGKPIPSPVVLGQVTEKFREAVKAEAGKAADSGLSVPARRTERRCRQRLPPEAGVRDQIVFIGVAQEKAKAFSGTKVNGQFQFNRDKTVYVNHYYFYIDDEDLGRYSQGL